MKNEWLDHVEEPKTMKVSMASDFVVNDEHCEWITDWIVKASITFSDDILELTVLDDVEGKVFEWANKPDAKTFTLEAFDRHGNVTKKFIITNATCIINDLEFNNNDPGPAMHVLTFSYDNVIKV